MLPNLTFASFLAYSPRGTSALSQESRQLCGAVKSWHEPTTANLFDRLLADPAAERLRALLMGETTLVPTPRSAPLVAGGLWPGRLIGEALVARGFGRRVVHALERATAVPKSAFAGRGARPTVDQHYASFRAVGDLEVTGRIVLVDDVVTKGATLLAGASRLAEAYPGFVIEAFAMVRTTGLVPEVARIVDPVFGVITSDLFGGCDREP